MTWTILRVNLTPEITPVLETNIIFKPKSSNQQTNQPTHSTEYSTTHTPRQSPYPKSNTTNGLDCDVLVGDESEIFEVIKTILMEPGGLIAIPTETVYGLAGNIHLETSLLRIFSIKDRPFNDPLIVHVHSFLYALRHLYDVNDAEAFLILFLAEKFAPGPLTIVARKAQSISPLLTNQTDFIAVRCPNNKVTLKLLEFIQVPLAAPSANKFGHISPTCPEHVKNEFPNEDLYILDDGNCTIGIESTIIKLTSNNTNESTDDRDRNTDRDRSYRSAEDYDTSVMNDTSNMDYISEMNYGTSDMDLGYLSTRDFRPPDMDYRPRDMDYGSNRSLRGSIDKYDMLQKIIKSNGNNTGYSTDLSTGYRNFLYGTSGYGGGNTLAFENFKNCRAEIELLRKGSITLQEITSTLSQFPNIIIKDYTNSSSTSTPSPSTVSSSTLSPSNASPNTLITNALNSKVSILSDIGSTTYGNSDIQMPGMFKSHYSPLVPTYIIKKIEMQEKKMELHKGTSKNSTLTGDLTYNLNFDYEEFNCSNIILIDIGNHFRKYSHLFSLYLPLGSNPNEVANKLYSTLRRAESKAIQSNLTPGTSTSITSASDKGPVTGPIAGTKGMSNINWNRVRNKIIAINFGVDNETLFSAVYDRILKASAGKIIHLHQVENTIKFLLY